MDSVKAVCVIETVVWFDLFSALWLMYQLSWSCSTGLGRIKAHGILRTLSVLCADKGGAQLLLQGVEGRAGSHVQQSWDSRVLLQQTASAAVSARPRQSQGTRSNPSSGHSLYLLNLCSCCLLYCLDHSFANRHSCLTLATNQEHRYRHYWTYCGKYRSADDTCLSA